MRNQYTSLGRNERGSMLVSLLIATVITSFVMMAMSTLLFTNTAEYNRLFTRTDSLIAASVAFDRLGRLIRMARSLGDIQGDTMIATDPYAAFPPGPSGDAFAVQSNSVDLSQVEAGTACNISAKFPSSADYYYNASTGALFSTIGTWPWSSSMTKGQYTLSEQTLILQVQCFDTSGIPLVIAGETNLPALDTYVFNVLQDTTRSGPVPQYMLQMACFPAAAGITNMPTGMKPGVPVTLCTGIIGPLNTTTGLPSVFQYINSSDNSTQTNFDDSTGTGVANEDDLILFKGVVVNVQVANTDGAGNTQDVALRSEFYLRNNSSATILGPG
jgi:hypothetical protein